MREIKFRAWDNRRGRYDYSDKENCCAWDTCCHYAEEAGIGIEQYTGLKDKNGVEIYEGDIVKIVWPTNMTDLYFVRWNNKSASHLGCYEFSSFKNDNYYTGSAGNNVEVIGNIHENPELP